MNCKYCGESYRLTKFHKDPHACPDCDGITDNHSISDEEIKVDAWQLKHPTGRTKPVFEYDEETDDI